MPRLTTKAKELIDQYPKQPSHRKMSELIVEELNEEYSHTAIANYRKKIEKLEKQKLPSESLQSLQTLQSEVDLQKQSIENSSQLESQEKVQEKPYYRLINESDFDQLIININQERIEVPSHVKQYFQTNTTVDGHYRGKGSSKTGSRLDPTLKRLCHALRDAKIFYVRSGE